MCVHTLTFSLQSLQIVPSQSPIKSLNWDQIGDNIDSESSWEFSGDVSLSANGSRVAIGFSSGNSDNDYSGHVRVYEYNGLTWQQLGSDIDGEDTCDESGNSVSLSANGERVAIGAPFNSGNGEWSGHVRVYGFVGSSWTQLGQDIDGENIDDGSGHSVSLSANGTRVAIGAMNNGVNGYDSGHVRIYEYDGSVWEQLGTDIDGESAGDLSGHAVSLSDMDQE